MIEGLSTKVSRGLTFEPILEGWDAIGEYIGISGEKAEFCFKDLFMQTGILMNRMSRITGRRTPMAFGSHIDIVFHKYLGFPEPKPVPDRLLVGTDNIKRCMGINKATLATWIPVMQRYGLVHIRYNGDSASSVFNRRMSAFESQCKAFLIIMQGGYKDTKPKDNVWKYYTDKSNEYQIDNILNSICEDNIDSSCNEACYGTN